VLYQIHEWQRKFLTPISTLAEATSQLFVSPYSPLSYAPFARRLAAGYDLLHRLGKEYDKPEFRISETEIGSLTVPIHEEIVVQKPFCNLIHFSREFPLSLKDTEANSPKVLLVAPLSGHHSTLLRDTVRALVQHCDVYVTDWVDARQVPISNGPFHLDDYVAYIIEFIQFLGEGLNIISVCQPTVPVLAAVSLMASAKMEPAPSSMIMMGGPIDTRKCPTQVNALAQKKSIEWFENNVILKVPANYPGYLRDVYPGFLQHAGFVAMNPDRHLKSHWDYYKDLVKGDQQDAETHRAFYDEYNAVLDLPAEYYLETIKIVFQEHRLPKGTWDVAGKRVRPQDIRKTALFTIEGELDDISGSGQTQAAHELCTDIPVDSKQHLTVQGAGHYGIFSGRRWREVVCPQIVSFIEKHKK